MSPRACKRAVHSARWFQPERLPLGAALFASGCFLSFAPGDEGAQPTSWPEIASLSLGLRHACAIGPEDDVICWGANDYGQSAPPDIPMKLVAAGQVHTCGITLEDGRAVCWGSDRTGRADAPANEQFVSLSAGGGHTCGITRDRAVLCWGSWHYVPPLPLPFEPPSQGEFRQVTQGDAHGCALSVAGKVTCWGDYYAFLGAPESKIFERIDSGFSHVCGLTSAGEVECWGEPLNEPNIPAGSYVDVSAGNATCALRDDGSFVCSNVVDPPPGPMTEVVAGRHHVCGVHEGGGVQCWKQAGSDMEQELTPPPQLHRRR